MSIQFIKSSREDISATLILSFAITARIYKINIGDSLTPFLLITSALGLFLTQVWSITPYLFKLLDKQNGFKGLTSYKYAWEHNHWQLYRSSLVANFRYMISAILLFDWNFLNTPFIYDWYPDIKKQIFFFILTIFIISMFNFSRLVSKLPRNLRIVRITNSLEDWSSEIIPELKINNWEEVYSKFNSRKLETVRTIDAILNDLTILSSEISDLTITSILKYELYKTVSNPITNRARNDRYRNSMFKNLTNGNNKLIPLSEKYGKKFNKILNEFNEDLTTLENGLKNEFQISKAIDSIYAILSAISTTHDIFKDILAELNINSSLNFNHIKILYTNITTNLGIQISSLTIDEPFLKTCATSLILSFDETLIYQQKLYKQNKYIEQIKQIIIQLSEKVSCFTIDDNPTTNDFMQRLEGYFTDMGLIFTDFKDLNLKNIEKMIKDYYSISSNYIKDISEAEKRLVSNLELYKFELDKLY